MIVSMTGFGADTAELGDTRYRVEARSVNHRFVEVRVRTPRDLASLDHEVTARVKRVIQRGHVDVHITALGLPDGVSSHRFDAAAAARLVDEVTRFVLERGLSVDITAGQLLLVPGLVTVASDPGVPDLAPLLEAVDRALGRLVEMRALEGGRLAQDIAERVTTLGGLIARIQHRQSETSPARHARLVHRFQSVLRDARAESHPHSDGPRIDPELLSLVERADVTEELVRLQSHLATFAEALRPPPGLSRSVGKKLEFLVQEIGRELNTIGSKSLDSDTTLAVVEGKVELERIREQVSNLE